MSESVAMESETAGSLDSESTEQVDPISSEETTEDLSGVEGENVETPAVDNTDTIKKLLAGKKIKVNGQESEISGIENEEDLMRFIQKGHAADVAFRERSTAQAEIIKMQQKIDDMNGESQRMMANPAEYFKANPKAEMYMQEQLFNEYLRPNATPEEIQAWESKKAQIENEDYKKRVEGLENEKQTNEQKIRQEGDRKEFLDRAANFVTTGVTGHESLKHLQKDPSISQNMMDYMKSALKKGMTPNPQRIANHVFNDTMGRLKTVLQNVPMETLETVLGDYHKRLDDHRKGKLKNPEAGTNVTNKDDVATRKTKKYETLDDFWKDK